MLGYSITQLRSHLGIDAEEISRRRAFFGIDEGVSVLIRRLDDLFGDEGQALAEDFCSYLLNQDELKSLIADQAALERLKRSLQQYFQSLASGDYGEDYVNERLRVGLVHQKVGLEPKWYIGAYRLYLSRLLPELGKHCGNDLGDFQLNLNAILSLMFFDMSLALDAYHGAYLHDFDGVKHALEIAHAEAQDLVLTYTGIINSIPANIALLDGSGVIISVNDGWRKFAEVNSYRGGGYGVGLNYLDTCRAAQGEDESDARRIADGIALILRRESAYFTHEYACHSPLEKRWFRAIVTPVDFGSHKGAVVMHLNTTDRKEREQALWRSANFDFLTNLPNRALLLDRIRQAINRAQRRGSSIALLFLDFDRFKLINDFFGHAAGDEILRVLSRRIEKCLREEDTVGRLSGDEFLVLLSNLPQHEDAMKVAQKLLDVTSQPIDLNGQKTFITCSIGIALYPEHGETAEILLRNSDTAMYAAKAAGRHEAHFYSVEEHEFRRAEPSSAAGKKA